MRNSYIHRIISLDGFDRRHENGFGTNDTNNMLHKVHRKKENKNKKRIEAASMRISKIPDRF